MLCGDIGMSAKELGAYRLNSETNEVLFGLT